MAGPDLGARMGACHRPSGPAGARAWRHRRAWRVPARHAHVRAVAGGGRDRLAGSSRDDRFIAVSGRIARRYADAADSSARMGAPASHSRRSDRHPARSARSGCLSAGGECARDIAVMVGAHAAKSVEPGSRGLCGHAPRPCGASRGFTWCLRYCARRAGRLEPSWHREEVVGMGDPYRKWCDGARRSGGRGRTRPPVGRPLRAGRNQQRRGGSGSAPARWTLVRGSWWR